MKVDINLSKGNRSTLVKLCKRLLPDYKHIIIRKRIAYLKTRWWNFNSNKIQVVDLVLLHIPQLINELYEEYDFDPVFYYEDNIASAVEYFGTKGINETIIDFLQYQIDNLEMSTRLNEEFNPEPIFLETQEEDVKETYVTKKIFKETLSFYYDRLTAVIEKITPLKIVYLNAESTCNSPPIRGPSKMYVTLLSA